MTPQSELEIKGNFLAHPFAELVAEIGQAGLSGSLRAGHKNNKCVVYFKSGRIAYAISNARTSRLFDMLIRRGRLSKEEITQVKNFQNDQELAAALQYKGLLSADECSSIFTEQIDAVVNSLLTWTAGEWSFSSLARIREGLSFSVDTREALLNYGRCMPVHTTLSRFRSLEETFSRSELSEMGLGLTPDEAFILSRADESPLTASNLVTVSAMAEAAALKAVFSLWLAGLLVRNRWQSAFSPSVIAHMRNARLELKQQARMFDRPIAPKDEAKAAEPATPDVVEKEPEIEMALDEYLERVENAETYYDLLGVDTKADVHDLKTAYFSLAKSFHPDRFHAQGGATLSRVQDAFTQLAQAHETLKNEESRAVYDYRMRKELTDREKRAADGTSDSHSLRLEQSAENFERGYNLLIDGHTADAVPFLARAVHYAPNNARYHAYYGKALSSDENQRHKAESEMQQALKIDPNNPTFRILLAEFFIQFNLKKRAEGELTRLLKVFPSNQEAREMLDRLRAS